MPLLSEDTEATQVSGSKGAITVRRYRGYSSFWQQRCHYCQKIQRLLKFLAAKVPLLSEDTEATQVSGSKGAITVRRYRGYSSFWQQRCHYCQKIQRLLKFLAAKVPLLSEDTEATQVSGSKGAITVRRYRGYSSFWQQRCHYCQKIQRLLKFLAAKVPLLSEDTEATQVRRYRGYSSSGSKAGSKGAITGSKGAITVRRYRGYSSFWQQRCHYCQKIQRLLKFLAAKVPLLSEDTEATQVSGSKGAITVRRYRGYSSFWQQRCHYCQKIQRLLKFLAAKVPLLSEDTEATQVSGSKGAITVRRYRGYSSFWQQRCHYCQKIQRLLKFLAAKVPLLSEDTEATQVSGSKGAITVRRYRGYSSFWQQRCHYCQKIQRLLKFLAAKVPLLSEDTEATQVSGSKGAITVRRYRGYSSFWQQRCHYCQKIQRLLKFLAAKVPLLSEDTEATQVSGSKGAITVRRYRGYSSFWQQRCHYCQKIQRLLKFLAAKVPLLSEDTEATQVSGSKGAITVRRYRGYSSFWQQRCHYCQKIQRLLKFLAAKVPLLSEDTEATQVSGSKGAITVRRYRGYSSFWQQRCHYCQKIQRLLKFLAKVPLLSEDTEATQVSGSKGAITVRRYRGYSSFWQQRCHYCQKIQRLLKFLAAKVPLLSEDTEATQVSGSKGAITVRRYRGYSSFWQQRCHYCQKIQRLLKFGSKGGSKGAITVRRYRGYSSFWQQRCHYCQKIQRLLKFLAAKVPLLSEDTEATQVSEDTAKVPLLSEDTEATQVSGSKGAITVRRYRGYSSFWQQRCHYCQKIQRLLKFLAAKVPLLSEDTEATQVSGSKGAITVRRYRGYSSFWQQRCHYCQKIQRLLKFLAAKVPLLSEDTEATQVSGSKGAITVRRYRGYSRAAKVPLLSEDTEATQVSGSKGAITVRRYRGYSSFWQQRCHYCQKIQRLLKFLAAKVPLLSEDTEATQVWQLAAKVPLLSEDTEATQVSGSKGAITVRRYRGYSSFWQQRCHYCQKIQRLLKFLAAKVPLLSEDTEATQVSGSKGAITVRRYRGYSSFWQQRCHYCQKIQRLLKFLAAKVPLLSEDTKHYWGKKYSGINYTSVTNGMLCQYCSHIYKEDREVLKHTQGAWISFPVSNWKKALGKMKAHEASACHKMAKAKVEAEKQSQAEGSVILQLKQGKERCDEQTKQQNCILIKKLLRIMYFYVSRK